jgi:hypothetical protein
VVGPTPDGRAAQVIEAKVHLGLEIHLDFPRVKILFRGPRAGRRPELGDQDRFFRKKAFDAARQLFRAKQGL